MLPLMLVVWFLCIIPFCNIYQVDKSLYAINHDVFVMPARFWITGSARSDRSLWSRRAHALWLCERARLLIQLNWRSSDCAKLSMMILTKETPLQAMESESEWKGTNRWLGTDYQGLLPFSGQASKTSFQWMSLLARDALVYSQAHSKPLNLLANSLGTD